MKFAVIFPHLDERQRWRLIGAGARALGHGVTRWMEPAFGKAGITIADDMAGNFRIESAG